MRHEVQSFAKTIPLAFKDPFSKGQLGNAVLGLDTLCQLLVEAPGSRSIHALLNAVPIGNLVPALMNHVIDPSANGLDHNLSAFSFKKLEHVEIAVAFGSLRPELPCYLNGRLHPGPVHLDSIQTICHFSQRAG